MELLRFLSFLGLGLLFGAGVSAGGAESAALKFVEVSARSGLDFVHRHCGTGEKYPVETMGSGVAWLDFDGDGWLDIYLVQSGPLPGCTETGLRNRLYRNRGNGTFAEVPDAAGAADDGYGQGVAVGDYDGDGDPDLYVLNFGSNVLYRNDGGRFVDVTKAAGVGDRLWGSSAVFFDMEGDGDLDLYVANYLLFSLLENRLCGARRTPLGTSDPKDLLRLKDFRAYCHPDVYPAAPDLLYRNEGGGRFVDVTQMAGIYNDTEGKGLGVVSVDYDNDGDMDLYVANDSTMNFLYANDGAGRFVDQSLLSGTGFNSNGEAEAGMGIAVGDVNDDGWFDLFVTNLSAETNTIYLGQGVGLFSDATHRSELGSSSLVYVGFGTRFFDFDNDGQLDLFVGNGHVIDNIELTSTGETHAQPCLLYKGDGKGRFVEVASKLGVDLRKPIVSRGVATADYDNDGDVDLLVTTNNGPVRLFENRGGNRAGGSLTLRLVGRRSNRDAVGAVVEVKAGKLHYRQFVQAGGSYQSYSDPRLHLGLGSALKATVKIHWPSGKIEQFQEMEAGGIVTLEEGKGITDRRSYSEKKGEAGSK